MKKSILLTSLKKIRKSDSVPCPLVTDCFLWNGPVVSRFPESPAFSVPCLLRLKGSCHSPAGLIIMRREMVSVKESPTAPGVSRRN